MLRIDAGSLSLIPAPFPPISPRSNRSRSASLSRFEDLMAPTPPPSSRRCIARSASSTAPSWLSARNLQLSTTLSASEGTSLPAVSALTRTRFCPGVRSFLSTAPASSVSVTWTS